MENNVHPQKPCKIFNLVVLAIIVNRLYEHTALKMVNTWSAIHCYCYTFKTNTRFNLLYYSRVFLNTMGYKTVLKSFPVLMLFPGVGRTTTCFCTAHQLRFLNIFKQLKLTRENILWHIITRFKHLKKFYWNTAIFTQLWIVHGCF